MTELWRIDQTLIKILNVLGPGWLVLALVVLLAVAFGRIVHALLVATFVLVCTQVWWRPLYSFGHEIRWYLIGILFVRAILVLAGSRRNPWEGQFARRIVVALGGLALLSSGWADHPSFSFWMATSVCLGFAVTFGLLWRLSDDEEVIASFSRATVVLALLLFGWGFAVSGYAHTVGDRLLIAATQLGTGERYKSFFINPNAAGVIGAVLLPIIIAAPPEYLGKVGRLRLFAIAVTAATIFLSGSRSALIGSVMTVGLLAVYRFGAGAFLTMAMGGVGIAALAVYAPSDDIDEGALGHISRTKHLSTLSGRLELWQQGWDEAQDSLLIGHGWGASRALGGNVDLDYALDVGEVTGATNLHNAHLQLLIDVGVLGLGLFWAFCLCVLRSGYWILRAARTPRNAFSLVIFASALALLADTWVHGSIWSMGSPTTLVFWGLCAMALKEGDRARREVIADALQPAWAVPAPLAAAVAT